MGIFDFFKSAGEKAKQSEAAPKSEDLVSALKNFKIGADNVDVKVEGDKVILGGEIADQTALEKAVMTVGNYFGISKVDTDGIKVADASMRPSEFYEVKKGDTLSKIAEKVYGKGNANKYTMIFEANRPMLTHPDKIYPGQRLIIPQMTNIA